MCHAFGRRSRRGGTLIEVVAAVALLGGIFASSLRATSRMVRLQSDASGKIQAVDELDALLIEWTLGGGVPTDAEGEATHPNWMWRATSITEKFGPLDVNRVAIVIITEDGTELASCEVIVSGSTQQDDPGFEIGVPDVSRRERLLGP